MFKMILAFALWGCTGPLLKQFHAQPVALALSRAVFSGVTLWLASLVVGGYARPKGSASALGNGYTWLLGGLTLARDVLYMLSFAAWPVATGGLVYGYVPLFLPFFLDVLGFDRRGMTTHYRWLGLFMAFVGNYFIFRSLHGEPAAFNAPATLYGIGAAFSYLLIPIVAAKLQHDGYDTWAIVKAQVLSSTFLALPVAAVAYFAGGFGATDLTSLAPTLLLGLAIGAFATAIPLHYWYSCMEHSGIGRVSVLGFVEPMVSTLLSYFVIKDSVPTTMGLAGLTGLALALLTSIGEGHVEAVELVEQSHQPVLVERPTWRYFRIVCLQLIALPFLYPVISALVLGCTWKSVTGFYLDWEFPVLILLGLFATLNLWSYRPWARSLLVVYAIALCVQSFVFILRSQTELQDYVYGEALLLSALFAIPSLRLLWRLRGYKREAISATATMQTLSNGQTYIIRFADLSVSGSKFFVTADAAGLRKGSPVRLHLKAENVSIEIHARVSRVQQASASNDLEIAVKFHIERESDRYNLKLYMTSIAKSARKLAA